MNKSIYPKLAWQNLYKNRKFYFPYLLTVMGCSAAFYILTALIRNNGVPDTIRYSYLETYLGLGAWVTAIFSVIFLFYTNSFLIKQRKKELGLYNVLGMGKRHIALMLSIESVYTAIFGIIGGILIGILLQGAAMALIGRLMRFDIVYGFTVSPMAIMYTLILYSAILLITLLFNLRRLSAQSPIEMIREGSAGEREPKTKHLFAIAGVLMLGGGYFIALTVKTAVQAIGLYFIAVILVILGTYCLFTAVSISILKLLKKNKRFYYKTKNFIGISGMLYRMRRNAIGLANICILSTMVLVMVSGTLALFLGTEDMLNLRFPADLNFTIQYDPLAEKPFDKEKYKAGIIDFIKADGYECKNVSTRTIFNINLGRLSSGGYTLTRQDQMVAFSFMEYDDFISLTGANYEKLNQNEVLIYFEGYKFKEQRLLIDCTTRNSPNGELIAYNISETIDKSDASSLANIRHNNSEFCLVIVPNITELYRIYEANNEAYPASENYITCSMFIDLEADQLTVDEMDKIMINLENPDRINPLMADVGQCEYISIACRLPNEEDFYQTNGGFFFLGLFLGIIFIMATVLIIYYKQITEGYEDIDKYNIMRRVGLDRSEIKKSINSQMLVVFLAPLLVAAVHIAFNLRIVRMLLTLFGLYNGTITFLCTLGTLTAFALIYLAIYMLTARAYYRIVS